MIESAVVYGLNQVRVGRRVLGTADEQADLSAMEAAVKGEMDNGVGKRRVPRSAGQVGVLDAFGRVALAEQIGPGISNIVALGCKL